MPDLPKKMWNETGHLIRRCHQINQAIFFEELDVPDLTPVQAIALRMVFENPGIDQRRLAALVGLDEATLGGVVRRLVHRKLLERVTDAADRRSRRLHATPAGVACWNMAVPGLHRLRLRLLAPLEDEEAATLQLLLRRLVEAHESVINRRSPRPHHDQNLIAAEV